MISVPSTYGNVAVLTLKGKLVSEDDIQKLQDIVSMTLEEKSTSVVVNLKNVSWMSSTGIGALIRCLTTARNAGGDLRLAGLNDKVQNIFNITQLDKILQIYPTVTDAVDSFDSDPKN